MNRSFKKYLSLKKSAKFIIHPQSSGDKLLRQGDQWCWFSENFYINWTIWFNGSNKILNLNQLQNEHRGQGSNLGSLSRDEDWTGSVDCAIYVWLGMKPLKTWLWFNFEPSDGSNGSTVSLHVLKISILERNKELWRKINHTHPTISL
mgnify:CR=1 FL=1